MTTRFADHILKGIHSARPTATTVPAGTLYACSTHGLVYQSDGATWSTWATLGGGGGGSGRALVDPTGLTWAWRNQGSATITTNGASLALQAPADASDSFRIREKAVPSKPYTIIIHCKPLALRVDNASFEIGWLDSGSSGKLVGLQQICASSAMVMGVNKYTDPTTFSGAVYVVNFGIPQLIEWVKLTDAAGGNRTVSVSADGYNWILIHSVATNDYITPDKVFFSVNPRNASWPAALTIDSWEEF